MRYRLTEILTAVSRLLGRPPEKPVTLTEWNTTARELQRALVEDCKAKGWL